MRKRILGKIRRKKRKKTKKRNRKTKRRKSIMNMTMIWKRRTQKRNK